MVWPPRCILSVHRPYKTFIGGKVRLCTHEQLAIFGIGVRPAPYKLLPGGHASIIGAVVAALITLREIVSQ